jgi:2-iminoacetate synthase ThiH
MSPHLQRALDALLSGVTARIGRILDRAMAGEDITVEEGAQLFDALGSDLLIMTAVADYLCKKTVGDLVVYVVNRNINFTNVCVKACGFCAFSRGHMEVAVRRKGDET